MLDGGGGTARATFPSVLRQPKKAFFPSRVFPLATRPFLWLVAPMKPTEEGEEEALQRRKNSIRPPPTHPHPVWDPIFRLLPCKWGLEDASSPPDEQKEETGTFFFSRRPWLAREVGGEGGSAVHIASRGRGEEDLPGPHGGRERGGGKHEKLSTFRV